MVSSQSSIDNEVFTKVYDHIRPPLEAYYYVPTGDYVKVGAKAKGMRKVFGGDVEYDNFETEKLAEFQAVLKSKNWTLPEDWDQTEILRILEGYKYKSKDAWKGIKSHTEWRQSYMPPRLSEQGKQLLQRGLVYVHGRDHRYCPILVLNIKVMADAINEKIPLDELLHASFYLMDYVKEHMFIPGKVENWVVICDYSNLSTKDIPFSTLKKIMVMLQSNYRNRLNFSYGVNVPSFVHKLWSLAKLFLDELTIMKVKMFKGGCEEELFKHCNREQVEEKFGGSAPNVSQFWPLAETSSNYFADGETRYMHIAEEFHTLLEAERLREVSSVSLSSHSTDPMVCARDLPHKPLALVSMKCARPGENDGEEVKNNETSNPGVTPDDGNPHDQAKPSANDENNILGVQSNEGEVDYDSEKILRRDTGFYSTNKGSGGGIMINVISHKVTEDLIDKDNESTGEKGERLDLTLIRKETERKLEALSRRSTTSKIQFEINEEDQAAEDSDEELRKVEQLLAKNKRKPISNNQGSTVEGAEAASNTGGFCGMCRPRSDGTNNDSSGKCVIQ
eukprot:CAMPEP_0114984454 /NCGR_PEP_ID=MMETSP0216-20121206/7285_1 /TAXON_ID=223996 /ORGANISM="Protocruzia adherens, Strain Boccale" /LENGTH=561 /DNA_ID=CAMNT_0002346591 /DNA_START=167 /DNA_END=1852 /DNA_ORIENTATION=+